eukprot:GHVR01000067.1.p2 GENE.GHVR01000067.1~~GHVR01000067.1.p2  ORF type:complete len:119 (-),score=2.67 GHVR01000067.1:339-695(-)
MVTDYDRLPFSAIGYLYMAYSGNVFCGTACIIGVNLLLTCAHNIFRDGKEAIKIMFLPALNGKVKERYLVQRFHLPTEFRNFEEGSWKKRKLDYAILETKDNIDQKYGKLDMKFDVDM